MTNKIERYSLLRDGYQIIDGIPESNIDMCDWISTISDPTPEYNTIACAAVWLALYPKFNKLGFSLDPQRFPIFLTKHGFTANGYVAIANFFDLTLNQAMYIFCSFGYLSNNPYEPKGTTYMSDKQIWLYRVRKFLAYTERRIKHD